MGFGDMVDRDDLQGRGPMQGNLLLRFGLGGIAVVLVLLSISAYVVYSRFRIDVTEMHFAVLTKKVGVT